MARRVRFAIASLFVIGCGSGCGGGSATHPDAGSGTAGSGAGGTGGLHIPSGTGNAFGTGNATGTGTAGVTGTAGSGTAGAAGSAMPTGSLVFQGNMAALLNQGPACTAEEGATGDRWCAFFAPLQGYPANLYVLNVSKAAAGVAITCGQTDPNCLLLTASFTQDSVHAALFQGDTLVYYDASWSPFAWRPGMTAGRALYTADPTTMDVVLCIPSPKGTAVMCLRDLPMAMQTDPTNILLSDLLAGKADDAATPPLVRVETVISANMADVNFPHFQFGFPVPGSDAIAWSSRATKAGAEILKMQTIGNDASRATVASGVNSWRASPDGMRWYWLNAVSDSTGAGTLQSAPYPAGTMPANIATNAFQYDFPKLPMPSSLLVLDTQKNLRVFADPVGAPTTAQSLDTGVVGLIALSSQGHVSYGKATSTSGTTTFANIFVKKADGTGACTLTSATDGYPPDTFFTPDASGVAWIQRGSSAILAQYTSLSDCTKMNAGSAVVWVQPLGNRGVLYIDGYDSTTGTGSLEMRPVASGALTADPAALVSGQVGSLTVAPAGGADVLVYTVNGGGNDDGVYVRAFGN